MFIFFWIIIFVLLLSSIVAWRSLAPWVPTNTKDLDLVDTVAALSPGETFFEMGCGNGRVCIDIAKRHPEAHIMGIEMAPLLYFIAKVRVWLSPVSNVNIIFGNALTYDLSDIDVIYVFGLIETLNGEIKEKVMREMKESAKLISYVFSLKEWSGSAKTYRRSDISMGIHVYQK